MSRPRVDALEDLRLRGASSLVGAGELELGGPAQLLFAGDRAGDVRRLLVRRQEDLESLLDCRGQLLPRGGPGLIAGGRVLGRCRLLDGLGLSWIGRGRARSLGRGLIGGRRGRWIVVPAAGKQRDSRQQEHSGPGYAGGPDSE